MNPVNRWQSYIDEQIKRIIGDGNTAHLPGAGQPLNLDPDDPSVPADMRLALKIMQDHNVVPEWVMLGSELAATRERLLRKAGAYARSYQARLAEAARAGSAILERDAETRWQEACQRLSREIDEYNRRVLHYNVTIPPQVGQRVPLDAAEVIQRALAAQSS